MSVTKKDIFKHYGASVLIYGFLFLVIALCPFFNEGIDTLGFNYTDFFLIYYLLYVAIAPIVLLITKPESVLKSRSIAVLSYIKRQFRLNISLEERINNIEPKENEKESFVIFFMQTFFGVFCINILCNKIIPSLGYDFDFLKEMFSQAVQYAHTNGFFLGIMQYIDDTDDMWVTLMLGVITIVMAISYLTETNILKNKIKTIDTTAFGIISCIMCYYPLKAITEKIIPTYSSDMVEIDNMYIRISISILLLIAEFVITLSVLRLGTKSGNLTNRGIVTGFPYNIIRHPNYAMQMFMLILLNIPMYMDGGFSIFEKVLYTFGIICWIIIYYYRAITEERNLIKDSDYKNYCEKVKYRFLPKVF